VALAFQVLTDGARANRSDGEFFTALKEAGVKRVVDVRLNDNSQLAGFSKKEDLASE
jgi:hypothetical protein